MKWIRLMSLFLALWMFAAALAGCGQTEQKETEPGSGSGETESNPNGETVPGPGGQAGVDTYAEVDLSKYTLLRSDFASQSLISSFSLIRSTVRKMCDFNLPVATDYVDAKTNNRTEYELMVGRTNATEAKAYQDALTPGRYVIDTAGTKIFVIGYGDAETAYAANRFLYLLFGYSSDKYENEKYGSTIVRICREEGEMPSKILDPERPRTAYEPCLAEPLDVRTAFPTTGYKLTDTGIIFEATAGLTYKGRTEPGSYRIEMTVVDHGGETPIVQLMANSGVSGSEHICLSIEKGNFARMARATYERGGMNFKAKNPGRYTVRLEVHPAAGRAFYYVDEVFLGEMNVGDSDTPLVEECTFSVCGVGVGINVEIRDIKLESIDPVEARRYDVKQKTPDDANIYPKSEHAPAQTIYVLKGEGMTTAELMTAMTLQGLVNRTTPEIFVDYRSYNQDTRYMNIPQEENYLELLRDKGRTTVVSTLDELLVRFADRYEGVILGDCTQTKFSENLVTSLAGVLDAVYLPEEHYARIKDSIRKDVLFRSDGRFSSSVDAYRWLWNTYGDKFSKTVLFHAPSSNESSGHPAKVCRDYAVMSRALMFCTSDVETLADYDFYMELFASTAPNTPVIGRGGGCFPEFEMFQICGQFGKYFTYGFSTPNMSLFNSLEAGPLKQKVSATPKLTKDTVYVTFDLSEGDNLSWDYHLWMYNFRDKEARAAVAKGYSLCGALYYVAPAILEWYYQNATENDYFYLDGGGISNLASPDDFGVLYNEDDREEILSRMLELTNYVAKQTDTVVLRAIHNISDEMGKRYALECPQIEGLFSAYGNQTAAIGGTTSYRNSVYDIDGITRCRSYLTTFRPNLDSQLKALLAQNDAKNAKDGIVFAKVFVYCNQVLDDIGGMQDFVDQLEKATDKNVVVVRPDVFVRLYQDYVGG